MRVNLGKRLLILFLTSLACVGTDRSTKVLAAIHLPRDVMHSYFHDILRLGYSENTGGLLGLGSSLSHELRFWIFTVAVAIFLFILLYYLMTDSEQGVASLIGLSFVFSGGSSNLYDRIVNNGAVVDFLNLGLGPIRTGIFNAADVAIFAGIAMVLVDQSRRKSTT